MRVIFPSSAISRDGRVYVSRTNLIRSKHIFHGSRTQRHITGYSKKRLTLVEQNVSTNTTVNADEASATPPLNLSTSHPNQGQDGDPIVPLPPYHSADASNRPALVREFEQIRDRLSKVAIPDSLRVLDNASGIKQESRQALKLLSKSARFTKTTLKQLAIISNRQEEGDTFILSQEDLSTLFTISAPQIHFLQAEYAGLVVKNTFDEETSRLFRSFENHSSAFNLQSL